MSRLQLIDGIAVMSPRNPSAERRARRHHEAIRRWYKAILKAIEAAEHLREIDELYVYPKHNRIDPTTRVPYGVGGCLEDNWHELVEHAHHMQFLFEQAAATISSNVPADHLEG